MDKEAMKVCSLYFIMVIGVVLIVGGIVILVTSSIDDDKPDDTWSDFADKSNQYTDYMVEKYKGYGSVNASSTSARIVFISEGTFSVNVEKESNVIKWYYLYADDNGIRIEYHTMSYSSVMYSTDKIVSSYYIPYDAIRYVFVNNLPSEY